MGDGPRLESVQSDKRNAARIHSGVGFQSGVDRPKVDRTARKYISSWRRRIEYSGTRELQPRNIPARTHLGLAQNILVPWWFISSLLERLQNRRRNRHMEYPEIQPMDTITRLRRRRLCRSHTAPLGSRTTVKTRASWNQNNSSSPSSLNLHSTLSNNRWR